MLLMLLLDDLRRLRTKDIKHSVATTQFFISNKRPKKKLANSGHLYLCLCDAKSNFVRESSMTHFKISLEDTFQQSTPSFFSCAQKSETELVASLKTTSVRRRDNQKIVLAAVQQDTAFKNVCQHLVASHPVVSHIALHQYHASYWVYDPCVIQYRSHCGKTRAPIEVIAIPFLLRSAFCCF